MIQKIQVDRQRYDTRLYCGITYKNTAGDSLALPLHLHLICPVGQENERFPLLIYIGGGGWRVSNPERHLPELAYFAENGFTVASIEYCTTANGVFPEQIIDVRTAIRFLRCHAEQFKINPKYVFLMGGSAGAYLAAMATTLAGTENFRGNEYLEQTDDVLATICLYGLFDFCQLIQDAPDTCNSIVPVQLFLSPLNKETLRKASVATYVGKAKTPFLLLHGDHDEIVSYHQSELLYQQLLNAGVSAELYLISGGRHASQEFSQPEVQNIELNFLKKYLKGIEGNVRQCNEKTGIQPAGTAERAVQ